MQHTGKNRKRVKILIQRSDKLGDMIFTLPLFEHIKVRYPDAQIDVLTSPIGASLLEHHPLITTIHKIHWQQKPWLVSFYQLVKVIKAEKYDIYINVWNNPWMAWLGLLSQCRLRIGDNSNILLSKLYTHAVDQDWLNMMRHQVDSNLDLLDPLGISIEVPIRKIYPHKPTVEAMQRRLIKTLNPTKKNVVICCSTGGSNLPIPENVIADFVTKLTKTGAYNVVLCGVLEEGTQLHHLRGEQLLNLIDDTNLQELIALISIADFYVGGDTGPTHIASFLDKPILFYTPRKSQMPTNWGPLSPYFKIVRREYLLNNTSRMVDADLLYHKFCELVNQVLVQDAYSEDGKKTELIKNSIRILYLYNSRKTLNKANSGIKVCRQNGIVIYTCPVFKTYLFSLRLILKVINRRNITVVQDPFLPAWTLGVIRFVMGTIYQYRKPVLVRYPLHEFVKPTEYLKQYYQSFFRQ